MSDLSANGRVPRIKPASGDGSSVPTSRLPDRPEYLIVRWRLSHLIFTGLLFLLLSAMCFAPMPNAPVDRGYGVSSSRPVVIIVIPASIKRLVRGVCGIAFFNLALLGLIQIRHRVIAILSPEGVAWSVLFRWRRIRWADVTSTYYSPGRLFSRFSPPSHVMICFARDRRGVFIPTRASGTSVEEIRAYIHQYRPDLNTPIPRMNLRTTAPADPPPPSASGP